MEYDAEEEAYKARMRKWGMNDKDDQDVTIDDCLKDLTALREIHGERIKGIIIIPIYDHLDMNEFDNSYSDAEEIDTPPSNSYLCSGGVPLFEGIGAMESAKQKLLS